ncbi:hypothetical protein C0993_002250 [Termitomyces sp. T159_Od127]|nr:hypothetical protein C0993_002250 [Termitomyces sp. T159_Od127]
MAVVLNAFKLKPYDLEPIFDTWTNGPIFVGNPKKDLPVCEWLDKIQEGCEERRVPEEYWYKVAQHFMGPKAKARLDEVKAVIIKVHGGKYRWTWKKFKIAMQNMGWGIDATQKETIQVSKTSNSWWIKRKVNKDAKALQNDTQQSTLLRSTDKDVDEKAKSPSPPLRKSSVHETEITPRPTLSRTRTGLWPVRRSSKDDTVERPELPPKANLETAVVSTSQTSLSSNRSNATDSGSTLSSCKGMGSVKFILTGSSLDTTTTEAPLWLLNACNALEYITNEHPKTMSIISAILITAGSIPAIPAISAGAGGAVLASGAAHAIGAIAVGLGQALSMSVKNQNSQVQAPSTSR